MYTLQGYGSPSGKPHRPSEKFTIDLDNPDDQERLIKAVARGEALTSAAPTKAIPKTFQPLFKHPLPISDHSGYHESNLKRVQCCKLEKQAAAAREAALGVRPRHTSGGGTSSATGTSAAPSISGASSASAATGTSAWLPPILCNWSYTSEAKLTGKTYILDHQCTDMQAFSYDQREAMEDHWLVKEGHIILQVGIGTEWLDLPCKKWAMHTFGQHSPTCANDH